MRHYDPIADAVLDAPTKHSIPIGDVRTTEPATCFVEGFQFAWDSTSLKAFKTCPRKYFYEIVQGWTHKILPPPLAFGIYFHTCMETWHKLTIIHKMEKDEALLRIVRLAGLLGETISIGDTARTKETLVRSCVWYIDRFWDDSARTITKLDGTPAVEYSFTIPFEKVHGIQTYLCGHIDRVVEFQGELYPTDYKSTKRQLDTKFFAQFKPNTQIQNYITACYIMATEGSALDRKPSGLIIDGLQLGVNFTRFNRQVIKYTESEIEENIDGLVYWMTRANECATSGHWPKNEEACDMYGGCHFRPICRQSASNREQSLKTNFTQRTWDPLKAR